MTLFNGINDRFFFHLTSFQILFHQLFITHRQSIVEFFFCCTKIYTAFVQLLTKFFQQFLSIRSILIHLINEQKDWNLILF